MNTRHLHPIHLVMSCLLLIGCSESNNPIGGGSADSTFYPSTPGSSWTYDVIDHPNLSSDSIISELTIDVVSGGHMIDSTPVTKYRVICPDSIARRTLFGVDSIFFLSQSSESLMIYRSLEDTRPRIFLLLPLIVGKSWETTPGAFAYNSVVESKGNIHVSAGSFSDCYAIRITGGWWQAPQDQLSWYKESLGLVQSEYFQSGVINIRIKLQLKSYHLLPP
jgi:hypothetical protein